MRKNQKDKIISMYICWLKKITNQCKKEHCLTYLTRIKKSLSLLHVKPKNLMVLLKRLRLLYTVVSVKYVLG